MQRQKTIAVTIACIVLLLASISVAFLIYVLSTLGDDDAPENDKTLHAPPPPQASVHPTRIPTKPSVHPSEHHSERISDNESEIIFGDELSEIEAERLKELIRLAGKENLDGVSAPPAAVLHPTLLQGGTTFFGDELPEDLFSFGKSSDSGNSSDDLVFHDAASSPSESRALVSFEGSDEEDNIWSAENRDIAIQKIASVPVRLAKLTTNVSVNVVKKVASVVGHEMSYWAIKAAGTYLIIRVVSSERGRQMIVAALDWAFPELMRDARTVITNATAVWKVLKFAYDRITTSPLQAALETAKSLGVGGEALKDVIVGNIGADMSHSTIIDACKAAGIENCENIIPQDILVYTQPGIPPPPLRQDLLSDLPTSDTFSMEKAVLNSVLGEALGGGNNATLVQVPIDSPAIGFGGVLGQTNSSAPLVDIPMGTGLHLRVADITSQTLYPIRLRQELPDEIKNVVVNAASMSAECSAHANELLAQSVGDDEWVQLCHGNWRTGRALRNPEEMPIHKMTLDDMVQSDIPQPMVYITCMMVHRNREMCLQIAGLKEAPSWFSWMKFW